jgi:hypothetical protein
MHEGDPVHCWTQRAGSPSQRLRVGEGPHRHIDHRVRKHGVALVVRWPDLDGPKELLEGTTFKLTPNVSPPDAMV